MLFSKPKNDGISFDIELDYLSFESANSNEHFFA